MISVGLINSKEFKYRRMANGGEHVDKKILVVAKSRKECSGVLYWLDDRKVGYEVVGDGSDARGKIVSGKYSAVYLPSLFVGVNGECSSGRYFSRFFNFFPGKGVSREERASIKEGLSVLAKAEEERIPAFYSDVEFNYCMNSVDGVEFVLPHYPEEIVDALVGSD